MAAGLAFIPVSPPRSFRFSKVATPCSQNRTTHCQALAQGADSYHCVQDPIHSVCIFLCSHLAIPSPLVRSAHFKMPRERTRMGCKRGSSRGRVSHHPSSTTSDPSSEASEFYCNIYPATRSGRGRGRGQVITEVCSHHSNSHAARFRFPCTLGNSSFIVSITVERCEDVVGLGEVSHRAPLEPRMADQNVSQRRDTSGSAILNVTTHAGLSAPAGGDPSSIEGHPSGFEDPDQFGC